MLRDAMHQTADITAPGLVAVIRAAPTKQTDPLNKSEEFIEEMICAGPSCRMIILSVASRSISKTSDTIELVFYFGLLLVNPGWAEVKFHPEHDAIDKNLHVIPLAIDCFLQVLSSFTLSVDK
jgi:hypothetical protein